MQVNDKFDVAIIGGGVVGTAIARELSRYKIDIALLEKEADVGQGASNSNSGVVHSGYTCPIGTLKAELCVRGNRNFAEVCKELDVPYKKIEKLVVAFNIESLPGLYKYKYIGETNGADLRIIGEEQLKKMEPNVVNGKAAIYSPNSAITSPYELTIAFAENAVKNGAEVFLETEVTDIKKKNTDFIISTSKGEFRTTYVINSAGLYSDKIARMSGENKYKIHPARGEYYLLDKNATHLVSRLLYPVRQENGAGGGIHVTPTVDGNIMLGPSDAYIDDKEDYGTTSEMMKQLIKAGRKFVPKITARDVIRSFSGLRSKIELPDGSNLKEFIIKESPRYETFINLIGIESPGLTAASEIGKYVVNMIDEKENLGRDKDFDGTRESIKHFAELPEEEQDKLSKENPNYAEIVCRCENVTRQEILDALNNPLGVTTLKGIKYRTRATMGRCQGGYCMTRICEIMREEGIDIEDITLKEGKSNLFYGKVKDVM